MRSSTVGIIFLLLAIANAVKVKEGDSLPTTDLESDSSDSTQVGSGSPILNLHQDPASPSARVTLHRHTHKQSIEEQATEKKVEETLVLAETAKKYADVWFSPTSDEVASEQ